MNCWEGYLWMLRVVDGRGRFVVVMCFQDGAYEVFRGASEKDWSSVSFHVSISMHALYCALSSKDFTMVLRFCSCAVATALVEDALSEVALAQADNIRAFHCIALRLISLTSATQRMSTRRSQPQMQRIY